MMKTRCLQRMLIGVGLAMTLAVPWASATDYYVVMSSQQPSPPPSLWTNWGLAHTNLLEVVAAAGNNDTVYVTNNATYWLTNQITVSYAITVRSWGPGGILDPTNTILYGRYPNATNRHFQIANSGATLAGFTLTQGCESNGGSISLQSGMVTNCTIVSNYAQNSDGGGGLYLAGNGNGSVYNCALSGNTAKMGAGISIKDVGPWQIVNCRISGNSALETGYGGGILVNLNNASASAIISNCWVVSNRANNYGGGIALYSRAQCHNSFIIGNTVLTNQGGGIRMLGTSLIRNCLIANNIAKEGNTTASGGGILAGWGASIQNCTIVSNAAPAGNGGIQLTYATGPENKFENTIIWGNSGVNSNWYISAGTNIFTNCCTSPNIVSAFATAVNTITNDPRFVNNATDFQLQSDSPCINAGTNETWMIGVKDLGGLQRIDRFSGQVDIGAYEYLPSGTMFVIH
ncbi:MAG: right-handed parallel beta-helix repeat-containing protein [Kiritimatiellaeota bacterium]|nr:right-handed parallel beta-helix repeat-containing protein [Kiritimatiellota bacterium]